MIEKETEIKYLKNSQASLLENEFVLTEVLTLLKYSKQFYPDVPPSPSYCVNNRNIKT